MAQTSQTRVAALPPKKYGSTRRPAAPANQPAPANTSSVSIENLNQLQRAYGNRAVQRLIQRAQLGAGSQPSAGEAGGPVSDSLQKQIESARGGGQALDKQAGSNIGAALGSDFSTVRVHTDPAADLLNRSLRATAFTTGSDIFFSQGAYKPGAHSGQQLLAHELTHVVQQGSTKANKVQTKLSVGPASDAFEQQADRVAGSFNRIGAKPQVGFAPPGAPFQSAPGASGLVQRKGKRSENNKEDIGALQTWLKPLAQADLKRKEYSLRLRNMIKVFEAPALNLDEGSKDAVLDYLKAQNALFNPVVLAEVLQAKYKNKDKKTDFGAATNTASRSLNWFSSKFVKHKNWKEKKGARKVGSALASGASRLGTFLSMKAVDSLSRSQVTRAMAKSPSFLNLKDAYDSLIHVFGKPLHKAYRPEAVLAIAATNTVADVAQSMDVKTIFQKWSDKRKQKKLAVDMQDMQLPQEPMAHENPHMNDEDDSTIDEEI